MTRKYWFVLVILGATFATWGQPSLEMLIGLSKPSEVWEPVPVTVHFNERGMPSDAQDLFAGESLSQWRTKAGEPVDWTIENGVVTVVPGSGDIVTHERYCDVQLHLEWRVPEVDVSLEGQQRGNSGVFLQSRYEVQILDSFDNPTYVNGQAGAIYKQSPPLVNAMTAPRQWQRFDIIYSAPSFEAGAMSKPPRLTVLHNGVVIQHDFALAGTTEWIGPPKVVPHGCDGLLLQDHGNPVQFRNVWIRRLDDVAGRPHGP